MKKELLFIAMLLLLNFINSFGSSYVGADLNDNFGGFDGCGVNNISYAGDIKSSGDLIVSSYSNLVTAINTVNSGSTTDNYTIYIQNDFTITISDFTLPSGVDNNAKAIFTISKPCTIASNRGSTSTTEGALIEVTAKSSGLAYALFKVESEDVRITGLRIKGPDMTIGSSLDTYCDGHNRGILCYDENLEVDNCEIFGWIHAGILLGSGSKDANIHHNYFHHNMHYGLGYSIASSMSYDNNGTASGNINTNIYNNLFDYGRHAIAGEGYSGESYTATNNIFYPNFYLHILDMHSGGDRKETTISEVEKAGTKIIIENNTIFSKSNLVTKESSQIGGDTRYTHEKMGIHIRGIPEDICRIDNNWFIETVPNYSITQRIYDLSYNYDQYYYLIDNLETTNIYVANNIFNKTDIVCYSKIGDSLGDNKICIWNKNDTEYRNVYSNSGHPFDLMTTVDFDKDGIEEVALYRTYDDGKITIYDVNLDSPTDGTDYDANNHDDISTNIQNFSLIESIDYDDDGFDNEIVLYDNSNNQIKIYDKENGNSPVVSWTPSTANVTNLITGDFNRDGKDEIGLISSNILYFYTSTGTLIKNWTVPYSFNCVKSIDQDNDGYNNEIVFYTQTYLTKENLVEVYDYNGNSLFSEESNTGDYFQKMATGDFDYDGNDEIALYRYISSDNDTRITIYNICKYDDDRVKDGELKGDDGYTIHLDDPIDAIAPIIWDRRNSLGVNISAQRKQEIKEKKILQSPDSFILNVNYPNPFNPSTTISFEIPEDCFVSLNIYNIAGQRIKTLINKKSSAGYKSIVWDATNERGNKISSGVYILNMNTSTGFKKSMKMMYIK